MNTHAAVALALLLLGKEPDSGDAFKAVAADLTKLADAYDIGIAVEPNFPHGAINGRRATKAELTDYASLFITEFSRYPPKLVNRSKLKHIIFCKKLIFSDQPRGAIPDIGRETLYLDIRCGNGDMRYLRSVIHHDFFHIVDYWEQDQVGVDGRWSSLNPSGFTYGSGGASAQNIPYTGFLTDNFPGFLNHYSTTAATEDKAEIFANLVTNSAYMESKIKRDAVVRAKVKLLKERLARFCPDVNDAFWEKVQKTKR
jgi:hypothetical protein